MFFTAHPLALKFLPQAFAVQGSFQDFADQGSAVQGFTNQVAPTFKLLPIEAAPLFKLCRSRQRRCSSFADRGSAALQAFADRGSAALQGSCQAFAVQAAPFKFCRSRQSSFCRSRQRRSVQGRSSFADRGSAVVQALPIEAAPLLIQSGSGYGD
jgi:hypothetical protein